jgi:hypothetical protein
VPMVPKTRKVWKTREVQKPCSPTQMGGTNHNPGPIPCSICSGRGYTAEAQSYEEDVTEYVFQD